ncbi:hypothetical protein F945_03413 [Acinetobacter rudis CIP 110305]|uniref:Uncharacterized protein n=1 Tax=Acinetobacter rudis CIP 110305 TaxID=421052 RepID=S3MR82_9GAMM|nr:hypothetical protein F945_03413 [Acinetobacter rudis CIP 110305]
MEQNHQHEKDVAVTSLLHAFVSLGVLMLCIGFLLRTLFLFKYSQYVWWEISIYLLSGMIALIPLVFLTLYSIKSISRLYLEPLALKVHWFYIGILTIAGASMVLVFPAFNFLNSSLN